MNDHALLYTQRELRRQLFEGEQALRWRPARDLAAQLLLYLDDPTACWSMTAHWLREQLDADRVDGGLGGYAVTDARSDYVVGVESQRPDLGLPSVLGARFAARDPGLLAVWQSEGVAAIAEVEQASQMSTAMRGNLLAIGTAAKIAMPVWYRNRPLGLFCADWQRSAPHWNSEVCNQLPQLIGDLIGPVLGRISPMDSPAPRPSDTPNRSANDNAHTPGDARTHALCVLTPAELKVAELVARGLSYKEIARQLQRSVSTVDHHLRSIREKLGVRSTARLVRVLNDMR